MNIPIVRTVAALRTQLSVWRGNEERIALIPTMGALHAGHLSLVRLGQTRAERTVATIFVNPKQFGPAEDFSRYPRQEADDAAKLANVGCDLLFAPDAAEIYPPGFATAVHVGGVTEDLCGAARPGHFDGVATVVSKLLLMALPDCAIFGEKDYQQLLTIKRLTADLNIPVEIIGAPIVRETDGLALSSRNAFLSGEERQQALALPTALQSAAAMIVAGKTVDTALAMVWAAMMHGGFNRVDYVELRDAATLDAMTALDRPARLLAAGQIGRTRLIDNLAVFPSGNN
jgi:pantoate--beta-alanine ligase